MRVLSILLLCVSLIGCSHPKSLRIDTNFGTIKAVSDRLVLKVKL